LLLSTRAKPIAIPKPLKQPSGIPENEELRNKIAIVRQRHDSRAAKVSQEKQSQENVDISQESPQKKAPQYDPFTVKYPYEVLSARPRPPKCDPSNLEVTSCQPQTHSLICWCHPLIHTLLGAFRNT
jgi:hypothetical protein